MGDWRVGVDVGGSFTDLVAFNTRSRELRVHKVPTVKADPPSGVLHALARLSGDGVELGDVDAFLHGTTIGTNALLEMTGAKVGMLITEGFAAVPQVQAGSQPRPFLLFYHRPEHLVHPTLVRGVGERVSSAGAELAPLDVPATRQAVRGLRDVGVESIAVCFMFSYADPSHEREAKAVIQEEFPGCAVSLSSDIMPRIREWQRMSTTLVNAYLEPVLASYVGELDARLASCGVTTPQRFLMQSNGGVMPFTAAVRGGQTHHTLLSGPAAGAMSAAFLCATQGLGNVVSLDIGGTSADVAFIEGGAPGEVTQGVIEGRAIYSPMVDVEAVSAGGGTIAQVDRGGLLRVGPQSAGSDPGPACYGRGGQEATITDADVTLGYLAPDYFLGGDMPLDAAASARVLLDRIGRPLGLSTQEAAWGIVRVLEVKMADRISALAAERGAALREFALVAGGGAGPLHAAGVAEEIGIRRIIVPPRPGAFSALGLLCSDIVHDYVWTTVSELATTPLETAERRVRAARRAGAGRPGKRGDRPGAGHTHPRGRCPVRRPGLRASHAGQAGRVQRGGAARAAQPLRAPPQAPLRARVAGPGRRDRQLPAPRRRARPEVRGRRRRRDSGHGSPPPHPPGASPGGSAQDSSSPHTTGATPWTSARRSVGRPSSTKRTRPRSCRRAGG